MTRQYLILAHEGDTSHTYLATTDKDRRMATERADLEWARHRYLAYVVVVDRATGDEVYRTEEREVSRQMTLA